MTGRNPTGLRAHLWRHLAVTLAVLGLGAGARLLLDPAGFRHYHATEGEWHAHSHVHAGAHGHDRAASDVREHSAASAARPWTRSPASSPDPLTTPSAPRPERDDDAPDARYVAASGPVVSQPVVIAQPSGPPSFAGLFTPEVPPEPLRLREHATASPRGPPA